VAGSARGSMRDCFRCADSWTSNRLFFYQAFRMQFNGPRGQRIQITTADFISGHLTKLVTVCSPTCPCRLSTSPGFDSLVLLCLAFAPWNFSLTSFFSRRHAAFFSNYRPQFYRALLDELHVGMCGHYQRRSIALAATIYGFEFRWASHRMC
jgi:hypothetical protein